MNKDNVAEKGWRTQFNELRPFNSCSCYQCIAKIEGFIANLLTSHRLSLKEELMKKLPKECEFDCKEIINQVLKEK